MTHQVSSEQAVLVVEDEVLIRMEAVAMLEDEGFRAYQAKSADAAMKILSEKSDIGVLFTDVEMPGSMNGLMLAAYVDENWPDVRIIIASGVVGLTEQDMPKGACFVPKPYPTAEIADLLRKMTSSC